jgi:RNA polymerase sigma-70 factor (ECF subfamily)
MRAELNDALTLLRSRNPESVEKAIHLLQGTVYAFSMKVCGHREDAEDTMQEVLMRSLPYLAKLDDSRALAVWLYTVTRNRCWRSRRKPAHAPKETLSLDELMPDAAELQRLLQDRSPDPEMRAVRGEQDRLLQKAVLTLPARYRIVLVLHDMEGLDTDQVAQVLELQPGTVRVRLHRARLAVRKAAAHLLDGSNGHPRPKHPRGKKKLSRASGPSVGPRTAQCREIFANLSEFLDQRLEPQTCDKMRQHIEACPQCVAFLNDLGAAIDRCRKVEVHCDPRVSARLASLLTREYLRLTQQQPA